MAGFLVPSPLFLEYRCHKDGTGTQATILKDSEEELCLGIEGSFLRTSFVVLAPTNLQTVPGSLSSGVQSLKTKHNPKTAKRKQGDAGCLRDRLA